MTRNIKEAKMKMVMVTGKVSWRIWVKRVKIGSKNEKKNLTGLLL